MRKQYLKKFWQIWNSYDVNPGKRTRRACEKSFRQTVKKELRKAVKESVNG